MPIDFDFSPGFLIERNGHLLRNRVKRVIADLGLRLTPEEMATLGALIVEDGRRIGELARILIRDTTTVTRQVECLESKSCVERRPASEDRRAVEVFITDEGRRAYELFDPALDSVRKQALDGLSDRDLKHLSKCLRQIRENLLSHS